MNPERRYLPNTSARGIVLGDKRMDGDNEQLPRIRGTAAVFYDEANAEGTQYRLWRDTYERIMPGAFDRALKEDDVRALVNHASTNILGRNTAGTLTLSVDAAGLQYDIDTPDTRCGRDTVTSIQRGDLDGSSFQFRATSVTWEEFEDENERTVYIRNINDLMLYDVGPVTFPAYSGTSASTGERSTRSPSWLLGVGDRSEYRSGSNAEADTIMAELTSWMGKREAERFTRHRKLSLLELGG